jgi:hypothetical protein
MKIIFRADENQHSDVIAIDDSELMNMKKCSSGVAKIAGSGRRLTAVAGPVAWLVDKASLEARCGSADPVKAPHTGTSLVT